MLYVRDDDGIPVYVVCNKQGLCLISTTNGAIAYFVENYTKNLDPNLRLNVGGDPGTKKEKVKIFHHVRKYRR